MKITTNTTKCQRNELLRVLHHRDQAPSYPEVDIAANIIEEMLCRFPAPECWEQQEAVSKANAFLDRINNRGERSTRFVPYHNS